MNPDATGHARAARLTKHAKPNAAGYFRVARLTEHAKPVAGFVRAARLVDLPTTGQVFH